MNVIVETYKITKKIHINEKNYERYEFYFKDCRSPIELYRSEVDETTWDDLKQLRTGGVLGLRFDDSGTLPVTGWYPNTATTY